MKFTFKTNKLIGYYTATTDIKLKQKIVGSINQPRLDDVYYIRFMVIKDDINEDKNPNCSWKWITFDQTFEILDEAKKFINECINDILNKYNLHTIE